MRPLFFSVLKYFTDGKEACRADVQDALRAQYGNFKAFKDHAMDEALMTACSNGLIDESLLVFEVQYRLSGYYGGIKDGSYVLNTAQTVDEMLEILAGVNTEGQPSAE